MEEQFTEILEVALPYVTAIVGSAGFTSFVWALLRKLIVRKTKEISPDAQYAEIKKQLTDIKKEIYEMRGKTK